MTFNSSIFVVFLAIVLPLYYRLSHRGQNIMLLLASYVFYGWWDYRFLALLFVSTLLDYAVGIGLGRSTDPRTRKLLLSCSLFGQLGMLAFFKYFNFFADSAVHVLQFFGLNPDPLTLRIILPVGISFYTFQTLSYGIDVYRKQLEPTSDFISFALYVAFFPQLVAGPIERATHLLPQVIKPRFPQGDTMVVGTWLIAVGYVKKLVIADRLAEIADLGFTSTTPSIGSGMAWLCLYAFTFQIYADFSAYSDIARGLAKLMGFDFMRNFDQPYLVRNPAAFWRHWHISLSTWLRDYLYIPLGGNRGSAARTYRNLMITMLLGGLWHGAGWAYFFWGLYHGILLAVHRFFFADTPPKRPDSVLARAKHWGTVAFVFHVTCIGWLLFRAGAVPPDVDQFHLILNYLALLFVPSEWQTALPWLAPIVVLGGLAMVLQWFNDDMDRFHAWPLWNQAVAVAAAVLAIGVLGVFDGSQFIYFQF